VARKRHPPSSTPNPSPTAEDLRGERLQKLLAAAGLGSRREIEHWIAAGRVSVAGRIAKLGDRARPSETVCLDGKPLPRLPEPSRPPRVLLYHKPVGEIVTRSDPGGRQTVFAHLPAMRGAKWTAIGRLDVNTSGLLLMTDSGELANRLMHPRYGAEREYAVRALGRLGPAERRALLTGVELADGRAAFERLETSAEGEGGAGANRWYRVSLREGRNREVRRLFEAVGMRVNRLVRIRFGPVTLPRDLQAGRWRELEADEVERLLRHVGLRQ